MIQWISTHYSTKKECKYNFSNQFLVNHSSSPNIGSSHTYIIPLLAYPISHIHNLVIAVVSAGSDAVPIAVSQAAVSAVADTLSTVLALGHLFGLSLSDAEIADGHDAVILAAHPHIDTLFLAAE